MSNTIEAEEILKSCRTKVERAKTRCDQLTGERKGLLRTLKEKYDVDSVDDARSRLREITKEKSEVAAELKTGLEKLIVDFDLDIELEEDYE